MREDRTHFVHADHINMLTSFPTPIPHFYHSQYAFNHGHYRVDGRSAQAGKIIVLQVQGNDF